MKGSKLTSNLLKGYSVVMCSHCGTHSYYYGDDYKSAYECWKCADGKPQLLTEKEIDCDDVSSILEMELENANWHSACDYPTKMLRVLESNIEDVVLRNKIFRELAQSMYDMI